jgi:predicted acyl esterase
MRAAPLVLAVALASAAAAQSCVRPAAPPGGHPTAVDLVVPVTYSDGYQTFGSLIRPATAPPACGWPLVVHVHPLGQTRGFDLAMQMMIASRGYAVWSYDVRGQGQAIAANIGHAQAGSTMMGPIERCDLAEQIQFVAAQTAWTGVVDATRVAVMGSSQGGAHAWAAAAWSGQPLAVPGRPTLTFPTIRCVVPTDYVADEIDDWLRGGQLWSSWFVEAISGTYQGMPFDATFLQTCRSAFCAQDPAALLASFAAEGRPIAPALATSNVPVLYSHAYFDGIDNPLPAIARLEAMPGPHRTLLGTIGHGVPFDLAEREYRESMIVRWLDRWLWNDANGVELESAFVLPEVPLAAVDRDDPQSLWSRAHRTQVQTPAAATRLWLHDDFALRPIEPTAPQNDAPVQQTIDPLATTFTPTDYLTTPAVRDLANVLAVCPLQERVYASTVAAESQLAASATLHLHVVPQHANWMLAALLTVQPADPGAVEVMLASQAVASANSAPGVAETHDVRLPPIAVHVPAGATIRLRLRNLWLREAPMANALETAPLFHDFRVDVVHGDPAGTWLDLPLEPAAPRLVIDHTWLDLAAPVPLHATVRGGSVRAGFPFFAAVGMSGQQPGVPFLNDVVPIDGDWLVLMSAGSCEPPFFVNLLGFLDANGEAACQFDLSSVVLPQFLDGFCLTMCAFVWDGPWLPTGAAANPCDVMLR